MSITEKTFMSRRNLPRPTREFKVNAGARAWLIANLVARRAEKMKTVDAPGSVT